MRLSLAAPSRSVQLVSLSQADLISNAKVRNRISRNGANKCQELFVFDFRRNGMCVQCVLETWTACV